MIAGSTVDRVVVQINKRDSADSTRSIETSVCIGLKVGDAVIRINDDNDGIVIILCTRTL